MYLYLILRPRHSFIVYVCACGGGLFSHANWIIKPKYKIDNYFCFGKIANIFLTLCERSQPLGR